MANERDLGEVSPVERVKSSIPCRLVLEALSMKGYLKQSQIEAVTKGDENRGGEIALIFEARLAATGTNGIHITPAGDQFVRTEILRLTR